VYQDRIRTEIPITKQKTKKLTANRTLIHLTPTTPETISIQDQAELTTGKTRLRLLQVVVFGPGNGFPTATNVVVVVVGGGVHVVIRCSNL